MLGIRSDSALGTTCRGAGASLGVSHYSLSPARWFTGSADDKIVAREAGPAGQAVPDLMVGARPGPSTEK
jgi:hypothetical protein